MERDPLHERGSSRLAQRLLPKDIFRPKIIHEFESILAEHPIAVTSLLPFGEIDLIDRSAIEKLCKDGSNLRVRVKPGNDRHAFLTIMQAGIDFVADIVREPSDFASSSHNIWPFNVFSVSVFTFDA